MAITKKMQSIQNLRKSMPVANQQITDQRLAARDIQAKQALKQAPAGYQAAGAIGAGTAAGKGQDLVAGAQQAATADTRLGQAALVESGREGRADVAGLEMGLRQQREQNKNRIASLGSDVKARVMDSRRQFNEDRSGEKFLNGRQLADFAIHKAKSREEFLDYQQTVQQATERKIQMMDMAHKKLTQLLGNEHAMNELNLDQEAKKALLQKKADMEAAIAAAKAENANKNAMWGAAGAVVGGVAGAYFGGPAGAAAGAKAGEGLGTAAGAKYG